MSVVENREYQIEDPLMPQLFMQSWICPSLDQKGVILITHGLSEHSESYTHVGEALANEGWSVFAWDLQGHGRSQGKRGYVKDFQNFADDLKNVIKKIKQDEQIPTENFHLFGHSMGGLVTLVALTDDDAPEVQSATLSNPALGIAIPVPKIKEAASQWLNQFWPTLTLGNEVRHHDLSRDPKMVEAYGKDPLRHSKISSPLYLGMVGAMDRVKSNPLKLKTPSFFQISGSDKLVDPQASLDYFKEIDGPKKLKLYEDSFHEVYNDINKQEAIDHLLEHLGEYNS